MFSFNLFVSLSEDYVELGNEIVIFVWEFDGMAPAGVSRRLGCEFVIIYHVEVILHHGSVVNCVKVLGGLWLDLLTVSVDGYNMIIGFDNKFVIGTGAGVGAMSDSRIGLL